MTFPAKIDVPEDRRYTDFDGLKLLKSDVDVVILHHAAGLPPDSPQGRGRSRALRVGARCCGCLTGGNTNLESAKLAKEKGTGLCSGYC